MLRTCLTAGAKLSARSSGASGVSGQVRSQGHQVQSSSKEDEKTKSEADVDEAKDDDEDEKSDKEEEPKPGWWPIDRSVRPVNIGGLFAVPLGLLGLFHLQTGILIDDILQPPEEEESQRDRKEEVEEVQRPEQKEPK